jgi:hypothetical protein
MMVHGEEGQVPLMNRLDLKINHNFEVMHKKAGYLGNKQSIVGWFGYTIERF